MNRKFAIPAILAVLAFVFLSGCMQSPLENTETTTIYKFTKDAGVEFISEMTGNLTSAADDWSNCNEKIDSLFDMMISFSQMAAKDMNEEQKQQLEAFKKMKDIINCEFTQNKDANTGKLSFSMLITSESFGVLKSMGGSSSAGNFSDVVKKNEDGTIEVNMPVKEGTTSVNITGMQSQKPKEVRIFVEGEVLEFTPETYVKENGYYVFKDPATLEGKTLHIKYKKPSTALLSIMGFDITMDVLLIIGGAVLLLIIIIVAAILLLKRRKKKAPVQDYSQMTPEQRAKQAIIEGEKERIRQEMFQATAQDRHEEQPAQMPKPQPAQPQKPPQPAAGGDEAKIARLVALLKPKSREYASKEIRDTIVEGGYSEAIADEVIRRLGI